MAANVNLAVFWEDQHRGTDPSLMGMSDPETTYAQHEIRGIVGGPPCDILEVGIGAGDSIRHLAAQGHRVWAADIAPSALRKVQDVAETVLVADIPTRCVVGQFDLVLLHLVLQHCPDDAARALLTACARVARGPVSFQFAWMRSPLAGAFTGMWAHQNPDLGRLHFYRTPAEMERLLAFCPLEIRWRSGEIAYEQIRWHIWHGYAA